MFSIPLLSAQSVSVSGNAPSYAGTKLVFYFQADWITDTQQEAGSCLVSDQGDFALRLQLEAIRVLYVDLGKYRGYLFAEPGGTYEIVLPEKTEKSTEDILNPYFEPVDMHLGLSNFNESELNMLIVMFEDAYIPYYNKHVNDVYIKPDLKKLEDDIQTVEKPFANVGNEFFRQYRRYRYGLLKFFANQQRVLSLSQEYFNNFPILYDNPAYAELFNQVFDKFFVFFARTETGRQIYDDINRLKDYRALLKTLSTDNNVTNDTLKELVILKQIYDEYYGNQFSRSGLLQVLDTLISLTNISRHREIGQNIWHEITRLQPGFEPPQFELQDTEGNLVRLGDMKGSYVYLNFCTCQSYVCLNEFNMLSALYQRHKDRLVIITIATDPEEEILRQFLAKNNYSWKFLYYNKQPDILKEYDIRAFPTYFLIGPDGKLIYSPAPSPVENFEAKLFEAMRARGDL
jgi:peroxiredoxin